MPKIIITENPLDLSEWEIHEADDLREFLVQRYDKFPDTARIYHQQVALENDITPADEAGIERLGELPGPFYVVVYPGAEVAIYIAIAVVVAVAVSMLIVPAIPAMRNVQQESPNNGLSDRENRVRVAERIPDIYGTVISVPDLIAVPYKEFINHQEVEYAYMCIGRGSYAISADDVRDGDTKISDIGGAAVAVYGPDTSPNSGTAQLTIGDTITEPVWKAQRSNAVNGQVLKAPNEDRFIGSSDTKFVYPNQITTTASGIDFTQIFEAGDSFVILNAEYDDGSTAVDLDGTYTVSSVTDDDIFLSDPASVNSDWNDLTSYAGNETGLISPTLKTTRTNWIGPFALDVTDLEQIYVNVIALNGMYKDDGSQQYAVNATIRVGATPIDANGDPTGSEETFDGELVGSSSTRGTRALTIKFNPTFTGRCEVRVRRVTNTDLDFAGQVVDEVKWRDLYAMSPVSETDFGDVTTVQSVTYATDGALAVKQRKLNMDVTRKLPSRISGSTFTTSLSATNSAADIISAIALDPKIGNRTAAEIDFNNVYDTISEIETYFGTSEASEFNYTFDSDNFSFEETISTIAAAVFCTSYRRGNVLKLFFEKQNANSTLLFNHRNKLPGSEARTVQFGGLDENDGVEYEYVDPADGALVTLTVPTSPVPNAPKKIESVGVRSYNQAYFHAWRAWNKMQYQNILTEFDATQEADILVLNERILVADNTRTGTQDGEVLSQSGLTLTLSQDVTFESGETYTIFLQHIDGTVESLAATAGTASNQVVLASAPKAALSTDSGNFARATYQLVADSSDREIAFLVSEKTPRDNFTSTITAINYDDRYYQNDDVLL